MTEKRYYSDVELNQNKEFLYIPPGFMISKADYYAHLNSHAKSHDFVNPVYRYVVSKGYIKITKGFSNVVKQMRNCQGKK